MRISTVVVSSKGQIAIPQQFRTSANIEAGTVLLISEDKGRILLEPTGNLTAELQEHIGSLQEATQKTLKSVWENEQDEEWSKDLAKPTGRRRKASK